MAGVIGLIVLVCLLALNYRLISSMTSGIANRKLRSLIMSVSNFALVLLFVISLPVVGGYSYDSFQDMLDVLFDEETSTILTITIIGFLIAIFYFAAGAYSIWEEEKKQAKIEAEKRRIQDKMLHLQNKLKSIDEKINHEQTLIHFIELLKKCDEDVSCFENHPHLSNQRELLSSAEKIKQEIRSLSYELQSGGPI